MGKVILKEGEEEEKKEDTLQGFDSVFDLIGGAHYFQWFLFAIVSVQSMVLVNHHIGSVFLGYVPDHWCKISELGDVGWTVDQIRNISIPRKDTGNATNIEYESCKRYDVDFSRLAEMYGSFEEAYENLDFQDLKTLECREWSFDKSVMETSIVTDFNLVCGRRHLVALIQASYMGGVFVGSLLLGSVSDKLLGRRKAILVAQSLTIIAGFATAYANSFSAFIFFRFIIAVGVSGSYQNCFVLLLEHSDIAYRSFIGIVQQLPFAFGYMGMALYGYSFRRWDQLQLAFAITTFTMIINFWILPESARWLASKGRDEEAIERIHRIAKWNKKPLPSKEVLLPLLKTCRDDHEEEGKADAGSFFINLCNDLVVSGKNYFNLVRTPELRRRSLVIWTLFTTVALVYYGVVLDSASLTKDPFLMVFFGGLTEVPAYTVVVPFVSKWGRRPTLVLLFALTGIVFFAFVLTDADHLSTRILFSMTGKLFIASAFAVIYLLGAELYPTSARITGLGAAVLMGRFGSIVAPYIVEGLQPIYRDLPTLIFGIAAIAGSLVSGFLPETKDVKMEDSLREVEAGAKKRRNDAKEVKRANKDAKKADTPLPT